MSNAESFEQGAPEWHAARLGVPTASRLSDVLAKGRGGKGYGKARHTYMCELASERVIGEAAGRFQTADTERGHEMEPEARAVYEFITGSKVVEVGFFRRGGFGASPDGLIGEDGGLEIKSKAPQKLIALIDSDGTEKEHVIQCEGAMLATGRKWWDLSYYWPGLPMHTTRIHRDEERLADIQREIDAFNSDLNALVQKIEGYNS